MLRTLAHSFSLVASAAISLATVQCCPAVLLCCTGMLSNALCDCLMSTIAMDYAPSAHSQYALSPAEGPQTYGGLSQGYSVPATTR